MRDSVRLATELGVTVGSGSDVIGPGQGNRGRELVLKAGLIGAHAAIVGATRTNAALFNLQDRIGTIEGGKEADLILVAGQPLDDVALLARPECIPMVIKGGDVVKDEERRIADSAQRGTGSRPIPRQRTSRR
jgi:imidazolonepropionase-like amidohydrolase